jgi:hypothetical protein
MQSTSNLREADPHDVFVIEPDVSLAARADKAPLDLLYDVLSHPSDPQARIAPDFSVVDAAPPVDAAFRATDVNDIPEVSDIQSDDIKAGDIKVGDGRMLDHQPAMSRFVKRVVIGLFALGSAVGAAAWQHYGNDARAMLASWTPSFALASTPPAEKPVLADPPGASSVQAAAAPAQPSEAAAPDQAPSLQSMARDMAAMGQQINELKATIEQLRARQAELTTPPAKTTEAKPAEPAPRPRIAPPPAHATATPVRKPKQAFPYAPIAAAPATAQPQTAAAPVQLAPQAQAEDGGPVVRPPMPLH